MTSRFEVQKVVAWQALSLSQKRYSKGHLFISGIFDAGRLQAIDVRYFLENGQTVTPTPQGFRVDVIHLTRLLRILNMSPREIVDQEVFIRGTRSLRAYYTHDSYGEGVHIRYYTTSAKYTGWERRGLRFTLSDFARFRDSVLALDLERSQNSQIPDLFAGRVINKSTPVARLHARVDLQHGEEYVNEALLAFLRDLE